MNYHYLVIFGLQFVTHLSKLLHNFAEIFNI